MAYDLKQCPEPETAKLVLGAASIALIFDEQSQRPLARRNKIKVSGRLSGRTVLARACLALACARVGSCFSWSAQLTWGNRT
jgi:hypothetical protein